MPLCIYEHTMFHTGIIKVQAIREELPNRWQTAQPGDKSPVVCACEPGWGGRDVGIHPIRADLSGRAVLQRRFRQRFRCSHLLDLFGMYSGFGSPAEPAVLLV